MDAKKLSNLKKIIKIAKDSGLKRMKYEEIELEFHSNNIASKGVVAPAINVKDLYPTREEISDEDLLFASADSYEDIKEPRIPTTN